MLRKRVTRNAKYETSSFTLDPLLLPENLNFLAPFVLNDLKRIGNLNDGGYVVPYHLVGEAEFLISLGIHFDWSFDEHFTNLNPKIQVHAYDHTISKDLFVRQFRHGMVKMLIGGLSFKGLARRWQLLNSYRKFFTSKARHFEERIHNRIEKPCDATLDSVFSRAHSDKIFLKIDIEGSEYRLIEDISKYSAKIIAMVIEFHDTDPLRPVFLSAVKKLQDQFVIAHLHANNFAGVARDGLPDVLELTFIRRSDLQTDKRRITLPIPIVDSPNNPDELDYKIRFTRSAL